MRLTWDEIQSNAVRFSKRWKDAYNEEAQAQPFQLDFLRAFGVADPEAMGDFEYKVPLSNNRTGYLDYVWKGKIAIEMKSRGKDLSDAFDQLQNYMPHLPEDEIPDLWLVSDFELMRLCRRSTNELWDFKTKDLRKHIKRFADIAGYETERIRDDQVEVNIKAAEKMAKLHDALKIHGYEGHDLEVYLVRLLFCMFADDTGIFPQDNFLRYIEESKPDGSDLSERISKLFEVLNMPTDIRAKRTLLADELRKFQYINGPLFKELLPTAEFNAKMRQTLIDCVSFDWQEISPAVFGAMFQGVMDREQRRELGAHYTSEENILKVINPLFLDGLWEEFDRVKTNPTALEQFHEKIAKLKFLDPACGCGNFLIITYRELRLLELEVLKMKITTNQMVIDVSPLLKVSVEQFYGIECEDFPCQIAMVGMWLIDHQMNLRASEHFGQYYARLPLTQSATIVHANALRIDWENVVPKHELDYILGNPPFLGYSNQNPEQKSDMLSIYVDGNDRPFNTAGKIDYVAAWYYKAAEYLADTQIRAAFVSTNSITQGEQVAAVWKPLYDMFSIQIDFAYHTFKWSNEAKGKAAVHCVIVGFGSVRNHQAKRLYTSEGMELVDNINAYLVAAENVFIESRALPLWDAPNMITGNRPADGGHLIIADSDKEAFIAADPLSERYIRPFMGSAEFINNKPRWCLWLVDATPAELRKMPEVLQRISACKIDRENSRDLGRRKLAQTPSLFRETVSPDHSYVVVPATSSERRRYIPIGFVDPEVIVSNAVLVIPDSTLYHFGILTSNVHMAWVRAVCGRLKSDYRYSKDIVYNNFPWPDVTDAQRIAVEAAAQGVLAARSLCPDSSLADLYDPLTMPSELLAAHRELDRVVMYLYGFSVKDTTEVSCVAALMDLYRQKVAEQWTMEASIEGAVRNLGEV